MNISIRSLTIGLATLLWGAAFAQPLPPYPVTVLGHVNGCSPLNSVVTITSVQNTQPAVNVTVQVDGNCNYAATFMMDSPVGWFTASIPCTGAMQTGNGSYTVNTFDSTVVVIDLNCGGGNTDCLGVVNGSAQPGTPCQSAFGVLGTWSAACVCVADSSTTDCLGVVNGSALPGTSCQSPAGGVGIWTANCVCDPDSSNTGTDCLGVLNGSNLPGSPCWLTGGGAIGMWDNNCVCQDSTNTTGCSASFWVLQAYEGDSLNPNGGGSPIPYELWVWNLSQGSGNMSYSWSFGDGSGSTDPFPTHAYSGNGPYLLCLTIADAVGCTDQYCDSVSIDTDGILSGMILDGEVNANSNVERDNGFTINVRNGLTTALPEVPAISELQAWPNPANEDLYVALNARFDGAAMIAILDVNGREVAQVQRTLTSGRNQQLLDVKALPAGMYTVRVTDRSSGTITSLRFVRTR